MARTRSGAGRLALGALALAGTLSLGLWLRWALTGRVPLVGEFTHLRHAHSHLGYYGVLFPLAWAAWRRVGAPIPGPGVLATYAVATAVALVGFVRAGYGPEAIAASTVIGLIWLASVRPLLSRMRDMYDPLAVVPLGIVGALACVPPIALNLRTAPDVAQGFVATFLSGLLLAVIVPSTLATRREVRIPWPALAVAALGGAVALGVSEAWPARVGLVLYGLLLARVAWAADLPVHARLTWGAVGSGLLAIALGWLPNSRPVAIGAIHFLVLSPVLESLLPPRVREAARPWAWLIYHAGVALLAGPLVLQGVGQGAWTMLASAIGGTVVVAWWGVLGAAAYRADALFVDSEHGGVGPR